MKNTGYLHFEDYIPADFLSEPQSLIVEVGNGFGKTHSAIEYSVMIQKFGYFDRIYILEYSQKGCENVVNKIKDLGGFCFWHIGVEKFCPYFGKMKEFLEMGIPAGYFCYLCPLFRGKSRRIFLYLREKIENENVQVIKPEIVKETLLAKERFCTHLILRSFLLDPSFKLDKEIGLKWTPIFVVPGQLFLNHGCIGRWYKFSKRQKKERKTLFIIDESDSLFYHSLVTEIPILEPLDVDKEILEEFSPKRRDLSLIIDYYLQLIEKLKEIYVRRGLVSKEDINRIERIREEVQTYLRSFERRKKEIIKYVIENKVKTNVFRIVKVLDEITHIENIGYALQTLEKEDKEEKFILQDFDYGIRLMLDNEYPWRFVWKINLSATFPTFKSVESRFLSLRSKQVLSKIKRSTKIYENVYCSSITIFDKDSGILNRNKEIRYNIPRILKGIKEVVSAYEEKFEKRPRGIILWFGNSKQMKTFIETLKRSRIPIKKEGSIFLLYYKKIPILINYCGSKISRGIDLDTYDISIIIGPLLRPPRRVGFLDVLDFARSIAEAIQSAMRIVRSPSPAVPKLVVIESSMTTYFYSHFYPEWFKKIFNTNYIEITSSEDQS